MENEQEYTVGYIAEISKFVGLPIKAKMRTGKYIIRFHMKRRWGGEKKYAYECTVGTLAAHVVQIKNAGGKILAID